MRALAVVFRERGVVALEELEVPEPGEGQVLVAVKYSLISPGTEVAFLHGLPNTPKRYPQRPGYSAVGEVVAVGEGVERVEVGDLVCAKCPHASLALASEQAVMQVPEGVDPLDAVFFELGAIALQGVRKARVEVGEPVLVLGAGLVGQLAAQLARAAGGVPVLVADLIPFRLERALESGADHAVDLSQVALREGLTRALGRADVPVVIEATGSPEAVASALEVAARRGRVVLLGSTRGTTVVDFYSTVHRKGLTVVGAHVSTLPSLDSLPGWWTERDEWGAFFRLLRYGRLRVRHLITDVVKLKRAPEAYEWLARERDRHLGVVFKWE